jgi:hypothetical protein
MQVPRGSGIAVVVWNPLSLMRYPLVHSLEDHSRIRQFPEVPDYVLK